MQFIRRDDLQNMNCEKGVYVKRICDKTKSETSTAQKTIDLFHICETFSLVAGKVQLLVKTLKGKVCDSGKYSYSGGASMKIQVQKCRNYKQSLANVRIINYFNKLPI